MEKVRPWCGQPSDQRLQKNRTLIMPCHCCVIAMHEKTCGFLDLSTGLMLLFNSNEKCDYWHHFNCQILLFLVDFGRFTVSDAYKSVPWSASGTHVSVSARLTYIGNTRPLL